MISLQEQQQQSAWQELAPDLTPMLDILFILLVFFILTSNGVLKALEVDLPSKGAEQAQIADMPEPTVLEISRDGYMLADEPIKDIGALTAKLRSFIRSDSEATLVIASDRDVQVERLLEILTMLQAEGLQAANILMQEGDTK